MISPMNMFGTKKPSGLTVDPNLLGLWHFNDSVAADGAGAAFTGTTPNYSAAQFGNGANPSSANLINNMNIPFSSGPITIECWLKETVTNGAVNQDVGVTTAANGGGSLIYRLAGSTSGIMDSYFNAGAIGSTGTFSGSSGSAYTIQHLALVVGASETRAYHNGSQVNSIAKGYNDYTIDGASIVIYNSTGEPLIDELRIKAEEVYTGASFTVPSSPFSPYV